eukprot:2400329-Pyramimonas_sp.AAC.1
MCPPPGPPPRPLGRAQTHAFRPARVPRTRSSLGRPANPPALAIYASPWKPSEPKNPAARALASDAGRGNTLCS